MKCIKKNSKQLALMTLGPGSSTGVFCSSSISSRLEIEFSSVCPGFTLTFKSMSQCDVPKTESAIFKK